MLRADPPTLKASFSRTGANLGSRVGVTVQQHIVSRPLEAANPENPA